MTETTIQLSEKPWAQTAARIGWAILIVATLYVCYFSHLGAIGFVGPDEPRYAWVARDMVETRDWVTPRLYGKPWFEKPPLYYWGAAMCFKLFGVSEAAARLPSAISALLATLALAWLALRLYGAETARWLLLLLPTTVGMIGFSHAAATDMPFSGMLTVAMVCAAVVLGLTHNENTPIILRTPWFALVLFGFFLGAAVLAKGPAAIILCGGAVFFWALFTKRWRDAFRLLHPTTIAAFCLTALPWYFLCARRNPDFFRVFIIEHNFKRYLTPEFQHIQPFWYYGPVLLLGVFPWTMFLAVPALAGTRAIKTRRWNDTNSLFISSWIFFPLVFFTASKSKLPGYILPAIPPLVLALTHGVRNQISNLALKPRWVGLAAGAMAITIAVVPLFTYEHLPFASDVFPPPPLGWVLQTLFAAGIAALILGLRRKSGIALFCLVVALDFALVATLTGDSGRSLNDGLSVRLATQEAARIVAEHPGQPLYIFKLKRSFVYALNFCFHRELPEWSPENAAPALVFTSLGNLSDREIQRLVCPHYMAFPQVVVCKDPGSAARLPRSGQHE